MGATDVVYEVGSCPHWGVAGGGVQPLEDPESEPLLSGSGRARGRLAGR